MKIIVGLGNPGGKYINTRHNVGFAALGKFIQSQIKNEKLKMKNDNVKFKISKRLKAEIYETRIRDQKVVLAKPVTFMNKSGEAVRRLLQYNNVTIEQCNNDLYLIHDDLDIPLGKYKIQFGKGPREHGGVESVERALGTKDFWRVRIGVEHRDSENRISGEKYVLQEFTKEEKKIIDGVILEVAGKIKKRLCSGQFKTIS